MSPASSYNGFIFYIFLSKNRRQRIFFKKMPGSALFPDEPAPQTAAKKFPKGRSPPGTEKKKHTSAAAPAKKLESAGPGFRMLSQTSGRHLLFFRRWCWALSQRGTPLCRVRRERLSGPDLPHPAEEGDSSPPSPCLTPADGTGAVLSYQPLAYLRPPGRCFERKLKTRQRKPKASG